MAQRRKFINCVQSPRMAKIEVGGALVGAWMGHIGAQWIGSASLAGGRILSVIERTAPSIGALNLQPVAEPLLYAKLQRIIPGTKPRCDDGKLRPVRVGKRFAARPEFTAIRQN